MHLSVITIILLGAQLATSKIDIRHRSYKLTLFSADYKTTEHHEGKTSRMSLYSTFCGSCNNHGKAINDKLHTFALSTTNMNDEHGLVNLQFYRNADCKGEFTPGFSSHGNDYTYVVNPTMKSASSHKLCFINPAMTTTNLV
ncbi:hypothetical protein BJ138DRAFT_1144595 [Hygrophoropsis aurantiaca]|uniref:Uncharacterized protein n=1 Tax=Hygrophoropsis aurantiaca TaxID=72124 RepID=A0ACB8ALF6_9AGAM|nr:hypothetical protein BJ138DRAFT_1144595 [Hygrophoropsis aurantiaca]